MNSLWTLEISSWRAVHDLSECSCMPVYMIFWVFFLKDSTWAVGMLYWRTVHDHLECYSWRTASLYKHIFYNGTSKKKHSGTMRKKKKYEKISSRVEIRGHNSKIISTRQHITRNTKWMKIIISIHLIQNKILWHALLQIWRMILLQLLIVSWKHYFTGFKTITTLLIPKHKVNVMVIWMQSKVWKKKKTRSLH